MLYVPVYTHERRPYSNTLYPTSFNLDYLPAPRICVLRKTLVCVSPWALRLVGNFSCDCMFWDDRGGGLTGQPMGPQVDTANIRTVLSTNHVDSRSFSSRCWAFRRTHPSEDPIRLLGIRLAFFTLDSLLALRICAQHKTHGWCFTSCSRACKGFFV